MGTISVSQRVTATFKGNTVQSQEAISHSKESPAHSIAAPWLQKDHMCSLLPGAVLLQLQLSQTQTAVPSHGPASLTTNHRVHVSFCRMVSEPAAGGMRLQDHQGLV